MKKKTAALCMAALMAVTLTACGGQAGQAEPTPEVQPQALWGQQTLATRPVFKC